MIELALFLHYLCIGLLVCLATITVGIGQGLIGVATVQAVNIQAAAGGSLMRLSLLGMALLEFAALTGFACAFLLMFTTPVITMPVSLAHLGITIALAFSSTVVGYACYVPATEAALAVARQPLFSQSILRFMLIIQSIIQTPIVFGLIIALFIKTQVSSAMSIAEGMRLLAAGLCVGLGSIGPALGVAAFAKSAMRAVGISRHAYGKLLSFTFISQAIIETPILFSLVTSIIILGSHSNDLILSGIAALAAAWCAGIGTFGPGISSGRTAAKACEQIAYHEEQYSVLSRVSLFAQGIIDTAAIYALVVGLFIYFTRTV